MRYFRIEDPKLHNLRRSYIRSRNQAKYRGQCWDIDFDDYVELWSKHDNHERKGRGKDSLHLCRIDTDKGWHLYNVQITRRGEHLSKRMLEHYGKRK
jgi:hypothetical protein